MLFRFLILLVLLAGAQPALCQTLTERLHAVVGGNTNSDEILHPDLAFVFEADTSDPLSINLQWRIEEGYYLYRDKFKFAITEGQAQIDQASIDIPAGVMKEDPAFGKVEINVGDISMELPIQRESTAALPVTLELRYQGCKEDSVCYPPITKYLSLILPSYEPSAVGTRNKNDGPPAKSATLSEQDSIALRLRDGSLLLNIFLFFGAGLLLSLTPCVFPMIPILSGIIVGQGPQITTGKAFALSLSYVLAMALSYAVMGLIAGSFYFNLQAAFQNAWVISLFSAIFVALALSMFGFFELQLPSAIQTRLSAASNNQRSGTLQGAALMGAISAIIVGPCVAPPLAGALLYISQTGNALFGGIALFAMGLGFGVPLLIIGSSAGTLLPRAGNWMDAIKRVFGVIMLGVAIWFMERILPNQVSLLLWASLFIVSAVYLGALESLGPKAGWQGLWKGIGVLLLVYGVILVIGAGSGGKNIYRPLQGLTSNGTSQQVNKNTLSFKKIKSIDDLQAELVMAGEQGRFIMLDFYADWCVVCKEMEEYTFSDATVQGLLQNVVLLQADVTRNDEADRELLKTYQLYGPPAILLFGGDGRERQAYRVVGFMNAENFTRHLKEATRS